MTKTKRGVFVVLLQRNGSKLLAVGTTASLVG